eukprot:scaffold626434_cov47-Prasinocladus_malaysianus.AAC.1
MPPSRGPPTEDFSGRKIKRWERQGHNFPDFIEHWGRRPFYIVGRSAAFSCAAGTVGAAALAVTAGPTAISSLAAAGAVSYYWYQGFYDMSQNSHTIKRNYPVLGNIRFILESIRPEIRQYFVEADTELTLFDGTYLYMASESWLECFQATPYSRMERSIVYQRAKLVQDSM